MTTELDSTTGSSAARAAADEAGRTAARREIVLFLVLTAVLTVASTLAARAAGADIRHPDQAPPAGQLALFSTAFWPAVAALVTRKVVGGRVLRSGWGFRRASLRSLRTAWALPVGGAVVGYAAVWLSGLGELRPDGAASAVGLGSHPALGATLAAVLGLTAGVLPWALLAIGEEVGWRGLLVPRLAEVTTFGRTALLSGLAWSLFHLPVLLFVPGAVLTNLPVAFGCMLVAELAMAWPMAALTLRTGSIWPAVVLHGAVNAGLYMFGDPLTGDNGSTEYWAGETGVLTTLGLVAVITAWWLVRGRHDRRAPGAGRRQ